MTWLRAHRSVIAIGVGVVLLVLAAAVLAWGLDRGEAILPTISCPVYEPPETPDPDWPTVCGGQREVVTYAGGINGPAAAVSLALAFLGAVSIWYGIRARPERR